MPPKNDKKKKRKKPDMIGNELADVVSRLELLEIFGRFYRDRPSKYVHKSPVKSDILISQLKTHQTSNFSGQRLFHFLKR